MIRIVLRLLYLCIIGFFYTLALFGVLVWTSVTAHCQNAPNCNQQNGILSATGTGPNYNATSVKCVAWTFAYYAEGFATLSIQVESAPDVAGVPGAFTVVPVGNVVTGTNPSTGIVSGSLTINGYFPWMRVNLTATTGGPGFVNFTLIGNSYVGPSSNTTSTGTGGTTSTVNGPDAPGVAPTKNPVQDSGVDSAGLVRRLNTTPQASGAGAGSLVVAGTQPVAQTPSDNPVLVGGVDGTPLVRRFLLDSSGHPLVGFNNQGAAALDGVSNSNVDPPNTTGANAPLLIAQDFNGTTWDRERSASLANFPAAETLVARNVIGSQLEEKNSRWSVFSNPAAAAQATASIVAEASVRHVVDCISFSAVASGATVATNLTINVRDGATGAGTIIWTWQVGSGILALGGTFAVPHSICGLNLAGATNTAMTAEWSAGLAGLIESVSISGYNVN